MPSEVILPRVDMDMATGKISKWLVDDGAPVRKGQPLFEIETDKAAMEIEAEASGTIRTLARAGAADVAVGSVVAWIYRDGETAGATPSAPPTAAPTKTLLREGPTDAPAAVSRQVAPTSDTSLASSTTETSADGIRATPLARRLARERGHELSALSGTGPRGRVQAADIPAAAPAGSSSIADTAPTAVGGMLRDLPAAPGAAPPARRTASGSVATFREGTGTPLVLLHGFGGDRDGWRPFLQGYGGTRPVMALDLPGHGASGLDGAATFEALVDGVEATLLAADLGTFTLVGHSLGGAVAAAVAARGAVDLDALILLAPAGLGPEINGGFVDGFLRATSEASMTPWLRELVADPSLVTPAFVRLSMRAREPALDSQRRVAAAVFPDGTQAFSIRADLARIACPVRVIVGTADRIVPPRHADALPALVALHRLAGVGHMPQVEARETVHAIVAQAARG